MILRNEEKMIILSAVLHYLSVNCQTCLFSRNYMRYIMSPDGKRNQLIQAIGFSIIAIGLAVLLVTYFEASMLLIVPIALLVIGAYVMIAVGILGRNKNNWNAGEKKTGRILFAGSLLAVVGVLFIANYVWPGNEIILLALALIWLGLSVMLMSKKTDSFASGRKVAN